MPDLTDKQGVQRFLGMVNYLSPFIPNKAELTEPLRQLVKDGVPFTWGRAQKEATKRIKAVLSSQVILRYYDENIPGWAWSMSLARRTANILCFEVYD